MYANPLEGVPDEKRWHESVGLHGVSTKIHQIANWRYGLVKPSQTAHRAKDGVVSNAYLSEEEVQAHIDECYGN